MRIIGGKWRSRKLGRPACTETRPMPDRVKQSLFDMLGHYFDCPGAIPALRVADVFAGSGSMGLEALSRGADHCCFFERHRAVLEVLRQNISTLASQDSALVVTGDAWRLASQTVDDRFFDLIFLDPPYRDSADSTPDGLVRQYLRRVADAGSGRPLVVLHHDGKVRFDLTPDDPWRIVDERRIGSNRVTVFSL
ncbi:MAG: 16S rRNA (guanine(966)-N(2))-methyltransferase RsmD [Planctomycetes bacterium]|nr:16S rRNA (guanine(966)-N(2))-methyltransferase RsmD [Planctomycetota bacterium]